MSDLYDSIDVFLKALSILLILLSFGLFIVKSFICFIEVSEIKEMLEEMRGKKK